MENSVVIGDERRSWAMEGRGPDEQTLSSLAGDCRSWERAHELLCQMILPREPRLELFARMGPTWTGNLIPGAHAFEWRGGGQSRCWFWDFERGSFVHAFSSEEDVCTLIVSALLEVHGKAGEVSLLALDAVRDGLKAAERRDLISVVRVTRILSRVLDTLIARAAQEEPRATLQRIGA